MPVSLAREAAIPVLAVLLSFLVFSTGCDLFGHKSDEQLQVPGQLTATFAENDSMGRHVRTLGSFKVSQPRAVALDHALQASLGPEVPESAVIRVDHAPADAIVFLAGVDPASGRIIFLGRGFSAPSSSNLFAGSTRTDSLTNDVKLHAFFVEGIGEIPDKPIRLTIEPAEDSVETTEVKLDPEHHTLPARYALRVDEDDIGVLPRSNNADIALRYGEKAEPRRGDPYVLLARRQPTGRGSDWGGTVTDGGISVDHTSDEPTTDFEFIVMVLTNHGTTGESK